MAEKYIPYTIWKHRMDKSIALFESLEARFGLLPEINPPYLFDASDENSDLIMELTIQGKTIKIRIPHDGDPFTEDQSDIELIDNVYRERLVSLLKG